jgi:hypothetical protein
MMEGQILADVCRAQFDLRTLAVGTIITPEASRREFRNVATAAVARPLTHRVRS